MLDDGEPLLVFNPALLRDDFTTCLQSNGFLDLRRAARGLAAGDELTPITRERGLTISDDAVTPSDGDCFYWALRDQVRHFALSLCFYDLRSPAFVAERSPATEAPASVSCQLTEPRPASWHSWSALVTRRIPSRSLM